MKPVQSIDDIVSKNSFWKLYKPWVPLYGTIPVVKSALRDDSKAINEREHGQAFYLAVGIYQGIFLKETYKFITPYVEKFLQ